MVVHAKIDELKGMIVGDGAKELIVRRVVGDIIDNGGMVRVGSFGGDDGVIFLVTLDDVPAHCQSEHLCGLGNALTKA